MRRLLLWLPSIALLAGLAQACHASSSAPAAAANPADFVGSEVCATCHEAETKSFPSNPHAKMTLMHGSTGATCENCHGAGKAHVESGGDATKILQLSKASAKVVDATCLGCHAGVHPNFDRSPHGRAGVSCTSCHSVHAGDTEEKLLKAPEPKLCYQCHTGQKAQFDMPVHHKVNEGLVKCSDCHDVHGTFQANNVKVIADQNAICSKCHTETRGPWVFEHAAVKGEGCMACHTPHGSQNPRLLVVANINQLCNQCHSPVSAASVHGINAGSADRQPCISCHTFIHGSNVNPAFLR